MRDRRGTAIRVALKALVAVRAVGSWIWRVRRWRPNPSRPSLVGALIVAVVGGLAGVGVLYVDYPYPASAEAFTSSGAFSLWQFLLCAQTALWALALLLLAASLRAVWRFGKGSWRSVLGSTVALAVVMVSFSVAGWFYQREYPFPYHEVKLTLVVAIGSLVALVGGLGATLVQAGLRRLAGTDLSSDADQRVAIGDFLLLRDQLQRILAIEGAIIGAAVLASAALRNAIVAYADKVEKARDAFPGVEPPSFPAEHVVIYGAMFTILLALVWAPIDNLQRAVAGRLGNAAVPERRAGEPWSDWHERRAKFDEFIGLSSTSRAGFRSAVAILTPLTSSLLGLLFEA